MYVCTFIHIHRKYHSPRLLSSFITSLVLRRLIENILFIKLVLIVLAIKGN